MINNFVKTIFALGFLLRMILLGVAYYMDNYHEIKFSDIDYKIVTDGARYVANGKSPFERHTYRYTPILAYLMIPNILFFESFGKILLLLLDLLVGYLVLTMNKKKTIYYQKIGLVLSLFNPSAFVLSVRGSFDVIITVLIFGVLVLLKKRKNFLAAVLYGFTIHFKIYPIIYCIAIYLYLMKQSKARLFNRLSICFGLTTLATLSLITLFFYRIYGFQFLFEGYLYHLTRKDHRHNYSLMFLMIYSTFHTIDHTTSVLLMALPIALILIISVKFYENLKIAFFLISLIFVTYNKVVTAQYFIWYLQFLPLIVDQLFSKISKSQLRSNLALYALWLTLELIWNVFARRFETFGHDVFIVFHITNCVFFLICVMIVFTSIRNYQIYRRMKSIKKD